MRIAFIKGATEVKPTISATEKKRLDIEAFKAEFIQHHNRKFKKITRIK